MATNISFSTYGFMNGILILSEENWRRFFKPFITDSVQSGLATIAGANMTVYVSAGECRCGAVMGILDGMIALDVANGDSTYDRIDSVIVQYTYGEPSTLAVAIIQGTPSTNPVPPTLTKVYDTLWQMEIAQILVPSGATSSSEFTITDKRVIYESIESIIDDNAESEERVWSSQKTREEIVSLSTEIYNSLNTKADVIERTVSGDIITITDGGDNLPVKELVVDIEPVQDLHGYDYPWPAGGGKNLLDYTLGYSGVGHNSPVGTVITMTVSSQQPTVNGNTVTINIPSNWGTIAWKTGLLNAGTYTVNIDVSQTSNSRLSIYTVDGQTNEVKTVYASTSSSAITRQVTADSGDYIVINEAVTVAETITAKNIQVETGSSYTSWTPYSNICPISGWDEAVVKRIGKNAYPILINQDHFKSNSSGSLTRNDDGSITVNCKDNTTNSGIYATTSLSSCVMAKTYAELRKHNTDVVISFMVYANQTAKIKIQSGTSYIFDVSTTPIKLSLVNALPTFYTPNSTYTNLTFTIYDVQLELGSVTSFYEPYQGTSVTIDLNGTRYGGTLDVLTGVLRITKAIVDLGTLSWGTYQSTYKVWDSSDIRRLVKCPSSSGILAEIISDRYPNRTWNELYDNRPDPSFIGVTIGASSSSSNWGKIRVRNGSEINTPTGQLIYELAAPLTVQLSPSQMSTLLGENHLWNTTGDVLNLTYRTDTKKYIEQKVADTNRKTCEIMTIVTDKMIAPDNLVIGDLVIVNDDLYKATANIASGATLTVGTNVQKLTLAEYIQSLL